MMLFIEFLCRFVFRELVAWKEISKLIEDLRSTKEFKKNELSQIRLVGYFSGFVHRNQKRADGSKYITHPIAVVRILVFDLKVFNLNMILAALLHDNAEDSGWPWGLVFFLIQMLSNDLVAIWVLFLSKHTFLQFYFEMLQFLRDLCLILLKLSDRIHNLRTLEFMSKESQKRKLQETVRYFPVFLDIVKRDIFLEKNQDLRDRIIDVENFVSRCEKVFEQAFSEAMIKYAQQDEGDLL